MTALPARLSPGWCWLRAAGPASRVETCVHVDGDRWLLHETTGGREIWIAIRAGYRSPAYATRAEAEHWLAVAQAPAERRAAQEEQSDE
ncbi:MAG TPA: hypothetical protein VFA70_15720 [Dehalococcoidia bacterium]|nr:hypothetical protein [Dehalococcoidia bacterium]